MNKTIHDEIDAKQKDDEAHEARFNELMAGMLKCGAVSYLEKASGNNESMTFETIISEGIDDAEGFILAMFLFYKYQKDAYASPELKADIATELIDKIEGLVKSYIECAIDAERGE